LEEKSFSINWLDDLKEKADIVSVVGSYVPLVRKGGKYWACCPFHAERTPSFCVDDTMGFWYCFGACHEGGNAITFEMKINNIGFHDAVKRLAAKVGMKLPEHFGTDSRQPDRDKLYDMMIEAARYYRSKLAENEQAQKYLKDRGITERTTAIFGLGYCPDSTGLIKYLTDKGFTRKQMYDCSLLGERDGEYYDFQTGRLIVPIFDPFGKVIGFGGRVLVKKEGVAKYKNSREGILFDKKKVLYGLNYVKKNKIGNPIDDIILVEGYMDVIGLYQAGIKNAVASMGTALTDNQAKTLKSMVDRVYICYDGDFAGQKSTLRGLEILKKHDLDIRVITLPDGKDPDEMVRDGVEPFLKCKQDALPLYDYLLKRAEEGLDLNTASGLAEYVKRALNVIAEADVVERNVYLDLISKKSNVARNRLEAVLDQTLQKQSVTRPEVDEQKELSPTELQENVGYVKAARYVLYYMMKNPLDSDRLVDAQWLTIDTHKKIYDYLIKCIADGRRPDPSSAYDLDGCDKKEIDAIFGLDVSFENEKEYFDDCKNFLRKRYLEIRKDELYKLYRVEIDSEKARKLAEDINDVIKQLKGLK